MTKPNSYPKFRKFWTEEKIQWLHNFGNEAVWDAEFKKVLTDSFNENFDCLKTTKLIWRRFLQVHQKPKKIGRSGNPRRVVVMSRGKGDYKLNCL
jgi:hypothetical protein